MKRILVTGATGQIGSELTLELRKKYGRDNVIAGFHNREPTGELADGPMERLDVTELGEVERIVYDYSVDTIYHLAAVLSAAGEKDPGLAWNVNMKGLINVLETSRKHSVSRVFWPSSIAVFGPDAPRVNTPQEVPLNPTTMYGITKVAGELLCNYYYVKYGIDVRCLRYPGLISSITQPGGGTTDYAVEIFYGAIKQREYTCFLREDTVLPMMYMPDAIRAAVEIMEAGESKIKRHRGYNITAMSFSPSELAREIAKYIDGFKCYYKPDERQKIADSWPMSIDDTEARSDWGWRPIYDMEAMTKDMIEKLSSKLHKGNR